MDPSVSPALRAELDAALLAKGSDYVARTRHKDASGAPKYTNRLIRESSPYLLQHAHNPVNWFPWGEEAFAMARATGRPVFLSIGYSTCHWCHVMEEESFEDVEVAKFLNEHYVAIKVDREQRPDVDSVYMTAVQMMTGRGGWPMSSWLTPDREPYFAGTYFPARDGDRGAREGFLTLLKREAERFRDDPQGVATKAGEMAARIRRTAAPQGSSSESAPVPAAPALLDAGEAAAKRYDPEHGGASGAPKFPSSFPVRFLLRHARRSGSEASMAMATATLRKMAAGGLYDHVGGGFHRYATDARWLVPHFEKMLYDNATLATAYVEAYQATGEEDFARVARETLDYVLREMTSPEGGFYSATDADSVGPSGEREEGYFFTWTPAEIAAATSETQARVVTALYAVTPRGNFEGRTILSTPAGRDEVAKSLSIPRRELDDTLGEAIVRLREARAKRPPPLRDDKVQVSWNGLMISALARAAFALDEPRYQGAAEKAATFVLTRMREGGRLHHTYLGGATSKEAFLDDYASLAVALCDLFELTGDARWLTEAAAAMETLEASYADETSGGYFLTPSDHEKLLVREKPDSDGPSPSGNTLALEALLRLSELTTDDKYRARSEAMLRAFSEALRTRPLSLDQMLLGVDFHSDRPKEIAVVLPDSAGAEPPGRELVDELRKTFLPNRVLVIATEEALRGPLGDAVPWAKDKPAKAGLATAYVCEAGACKLPVTSAAGLRKQLREVVPYE